MRLTANISLSPLICAFGIVALLAVMPFFVSAASPDVLPEACPGTLEDYNVIEGTDGDDELTGTDGADYILGYEGDDIIDGGEGTDCIVGGPGLDEIRHPTGDIYFLGEPPENVDAEEDEDDAPEAPEAPEGVFTAACTTFGTVVPVGRQVTFAAGHYGGEGEVTYRWLGAIVGEGQFQRPTFTTAGPKLITVVATDEEGRVATAGCPVLASASVSAPVYTPAPTPGGVGGAPGEGTGSGLGQGTVTPPAQGGTGTADDDTETPDDLVDGDEVDITGQDGTNAGRIVLWVLIALIIISLGVLFWQRYYQDESGEKVTKEKKEVKEEKKTETKKDTDKGGSSSGGDNGGSVIIPPAN